jgi:hypothetical protein
LAKTRVSVSPVIWGPPTACGSSGSVDMLHKIVALTRVPSTPVRPRFVDPDMDPKLTRFGPERNCSRTLSLSTYSGPCPEYVGFEAHDTRSEFAYTGGLSAICGHEYEVPHIWLAKGRRETKRLGAKKCSLLCVNTRSSTHDHFAPGTGGSSKYMQWDNGESTVPE